MAKADFITSLFLMVLGIGVVVESWNMPRFTDQGTSIWSAPGITPGMVGLVLAVLGVALLFRSRREAATGSMDGTTSAPSNWLQAGVAFVLCFGFAGILVGRVPFMLAAFLFAAAFILFFDYRDNRDAFSDRKRLALRIGLALLVAAVASWGISTIFQDMFFVRLP